MANPRTKSGKAKVPKTPPRRRPKSGLRAEPPTDAERALRRQIMFEHLGGIDPETGRPWLRLTNRYVRSTETWYSLCERCMTWVREGHAPLEVDIGLWAGRLAERTGSDDNTSLIALHDYLLPVVRDVFGVADLDAFETEEAHLYDRDDEPDHKSRCVPAVSEIVDPAEARARLAKKKMN
jgi:hypothetical protein